MFEKVFKNIDEILHKDADFDESYSKENDLKVSSKLLDDF